MPDNGYHEIRVAYGGQDLGKVKNKTIIWNKMIENLGKPSVDPVYTYAKYMKLSKERQDQRKADPGFFVGGHCDDGKRKLSAMHKRSVVTLDIDDATPEQIEYLKSGASDLCRFEFFAHTTRKHCQNYPRWRVVIPVVEDVSAEEYNAIARVLASMTFRTVEESMDAVDDVSNRFAQVMYWPSICREADFDTMHNEGELLDAEAVLDAWGDWHDFTKLPYSEKRGQKRPTIPGSKAEDPTEKRGIVGAFCRTFDVEDAIHEFLPDVYEEGDDSGSLKRYTYIPGTTSNGAVIYDDGLFLYSNHGSDPVAEMLVNAFDLVRIHKFENEDRNAKEDTPAIELPSFKAMGELAEEYDSVRREKAAFTIDVDATFDDIPDDEDDEDAEAGADADDLDAKFDDIDEDDPEPKGDEDEKKSRNAWLKDLEVTEHGAYKTTSSNLALVVYNDPRFGDRIRYNEFMQDVVLRGTLGSKRGIVASVRCTDKLNGNRWDDLYDDTMRTIIESPKGKGSPGYGMKVSDRDLKTAVNVAGYKRRFHPIKELIEEVEWDGVERLDRLFIDYLGEVDTAYTRMAARLFLVAAVTRIYEPGHKFDYMPIASSPQGFRKSTFVETLGWGFGGQLSGDISDPKKIVEDTSGKWIVELGELQSLKKSDNEDMKSFLSTGVDRARLSYRRNERDYARQCVFFGTSNYNTYLTDITGGRRYWPLSVGVEEIDTDRLQAEIPQIYAEAKHLYRIMREEKPRGPLDLSLKGKALDEAQERQEQVRIPDETEPMVERAKRFLDTPVTETRAIEEFEEVEDDGFDNDEDRIGYRCAVSAQMLWDKALGNAGRPMGQREINQVSKVMGQISGWEHRQIRYKGARFRAYVRDNAGTVPWLPKSHFEDSAEDDIPEDIADIL